VPSAAPRDTGAGRRSRPPVPPDGGTGPPSRAPPAAGPVCRLGRCGLLPFVAAQFTGGADAIEAPAECHGTPLRQAPPADPLPRPRGVHPERRDQHDRPHAQDARGQRAGPQAAAAAEQVAGAGRQRPVHPRARRRLAAGLEAQRDVPLPQLELVLAELASSPTVQLSLNISPDATTDTDWWSSIESCLRANPAIAFVIGGTRDGDERTVQCEGIADEPSGGELDRLLAVYYARFPDGPERRAWPGLIYVRVKPTWIRYSNFSADPPEIVEFDPSSWGR